MNHYLYLTVREKSTGRVGIVIDVSTDSVLVEFPSNAKWGSSFDTKWLKESEIIVYEE